VGLSGLNIALSAVLQIIVTGVNALPTPLSTLGVGVVASGIHNLVLAGARVFFDILANPCCLTPCAAALLNAVLLSISGSAYTTGGIFSGFPAVGPSIQTALEALAAVVIDFSSVVQRLAARDTTTDNNDDQKGENGKRKSCKQVNNAAVLQFFSAAVALISSVIALAAINLPPPQQALSASLAKLAVDLVNVGIAIAAGGCNLAFVSENLAFVFRQISGNIIITAFLSGAAAALNQLANQLCSVAIACEKAPRHKKKHCDDKNKKKKKQRKFCCPPCCANVENTLRQVSADAFAASAALSNLSITCASASPFPTISCCQ
jgi:hypothetical protein